MAYTITKSNPTPYTFIATIRTQNHTEVRPAEHGGIELNFDSSQSLPMKLGLHDVELGPNQMVIFDARQEHVELHKESTLTHKAIVLYNNYLDRFFAGQVPALDRARLISNPKVLMLARKIHEMSTSPYIPPTLFEYLCDELTLQLFSDPYLGYHQALGKRARRRLFEAIEDQEFSLAQLAEEFGMSKFHFLRSFSNTEGISPMKYLRQLRAEKFGFRLVEGKSSVTDTAFDVGFSSLSSFYETFKSTMKCTPRKFLIQVATKPNRVVSSTYQYLTVPLCPSMNSAPFDF